MPRKPRFYMPGVPVHVVQRGHNREPVFFHDDDYHAYLRWAQEGAMAHGCQIHAYVLMTNHIHLLITPEDKDAINYLMQSIGRHYVPYINHGYLGSDQKLPSVKQFRRKAPLDIHRAGLFHFSPSRQSTPAARP